MTRSSMEFRGSHAEYELLRKAVTRLHQEGISSRRLLHSAGIDGDRTTLDKFRRVDGTKRISDSMAAGLWNYISAQWPEYLSAGRDILSSDDPRNAGDTFFNAFVK